MNNHEDGMEEKLKEHLLANFCDGDSWEDADSLSLTKHGALDVAKYFYELGQDLTRQEIIREIEGKIRPRAEGEGKSGSTHNQKRKATNKMLREILSTLTKKPNE